MQQILTRKSKNRKLQKNYNLINKYTHTHAHKIIKGKN
jgi:hypothetical protein